MNYLVVNLKFLRERFSLSQHALSNKLLVNPKLYEAWEQGVSLPQTKELKILSNYYGVSIDWLVRKDLAKLGGMDVSKNYMEIQNRL